VKPLRIFHHAVCEPPAYLCAYLERRGLLFEVICIYEKQKVPNGLDDISGLIFMGGQGSVNDDKDWITQELSLIHQADSNNLPILGICFGAQLISKALGGSVYPGKDMEIGWHTIEAVNAKQINTKTDTENENHWLAGLPVHFDAFQWHAHTFTVPSGATPLWLSQCYQQQGFAKGRALAMQFHLEVTVESIQELTRHYAGDISHPSACVQSVEQLTDKLLARTDQLHQIADQIYDRWLTMAGLVKSANGLRR
jgi:GMP synthase-like glutamine amidotransferase